MRFTLLGDWRYAVSRIIVADENEGRRNLLANTFERSGMQVTRTSTLQQMQGTALSVMPEVVLLEAEWAGQDIFDVCQQLNSNPQFKTQTRIVVLSRTTSPDYLQQAAMSGVAEVIAKPIDMNFLISQLQRHMQKQFVPPPAQVMPQGQPSTGGMFGAPMPMSQATQIQDTEWAMPMLKQLVEGGKVNDEMIADIYASLEEDGIISSDEEEAPQLSVYVLQNALRFALNNLVGATPTQSETPKQSKESDDENTSPQTSNQPTIESLTRKNKLGQSPSVGSTLADAGGSMEDILQKQADDIARDVEQTMDKILEEQPEFVAILEDDERVPVDPEVLNLSRLTYDYLESLFEQLLRKGAVSDISLLTQIEDGATMIRDVLSSLPRGEEE